MLRILTSLMLFFAGTSLCLARVAAQPSSFAPRDAEEDAYTDIGIEQKLDAQIPLDLTFIDEHGNEVTLGDYFVEDRPVVLALMYYGCPGLCTAVLAGMCDTLQQLKLEMGEDLVVLSVSFDHEESHQLAAQKKANYLEKTPINGAEQHWHWLVGQQASTEKLTEVCGFQYKYNPKIDEYSHSSSLILLTPEGRISRYMPGIVYPERDLRMGLVEASRSKIGSLSDQLFLLCYKYDPTTGQYSLMISKTLRIAGLATVGALSLGIFVLFRQDNERQRSLAAAPTDKGKSTP